MQTIQCLAYASAILSFNGIVKCLYGINIYLSLYILHPHYVGKHFFYGPPGKTIRAIWQFAYTDVVWLVPPESDHFRNVRRLYNMGTVRRGNNLCQRERIFQDTCNFSLPFWMKMQVNFINKNHPSERTGGDVQLPKFNLFYDAQK